METPEETKARNLYEVGAKIKATDDFEVGFSYWPNGFLAFSFWEERIFVYSSLRPTNGPIAKFRFKSWKPQN